MIFKRLAAITVIGLACTAPASAQTDAQLGSSQYILNNIGPRDSSGAGARDYDSGPGGAADISQHLIDRSMSNQGLQHGFERIKNTERLRAEVGAINAVTLGNAQLDLAYQPQDLTAEFMTTLARTTKPPTGTEQFLHDRYAEAAESEKSLGFAVGDMADSCGYLVDSLYLAGDGLHATSGQRKLFQTGCIFDFTRYIATHPPMPSSVRSHYASRQLLLGSIFRYAALHKMPGTSESARKLFKSLTQHEMSKTPADDFVCTSAPESDSINCADFVARVTPHVDTILKTDRSNHR